MVVLGLGVGWKRTWKAGRPTKRVIRDPIHGDIPLQPVEAAVIATRAFQRLRYIRQNGLLHFVFPGAVHTRFAHSIGAKHVAGAVIEHLFAPLEDVASTKGDRQALDYLAATFRLAALLHDVGHCAFSHSIEHVTERGKPLMGTVGDFLRSWNQEGLLGEFIAARPGVAKRQVEHEHISILLVKEIFEKDAVRDVCRSEGLDPDDVGRDVRALIDNALPESATFKGASDVIVKLLAARRAVDGSRPKQAASDVLASLHSLVSGTLDVDRLDYLLRDSWFCGVPYGQVDLQILTSNMSLGIFAGKVQLLLHEKAVRAVDDMLWSRYQLFMQVYNHKTNVGLNAALSRAIEEARRVNFVEDPKDPKVLLAFTDDHVLGNLFMASEKGDLDDQLYVRMLVDRVVPRHLGHWDMGGKKPGEAKINEIASELASTHKIGRETIFHSLGFSQLVKGGSHPLVIRFRRGQAPEFRAFEEASTVVPSERTGRSAGPGPVHSVLHFFVHREL